MPAVELIAPRYGLDAGATVIRHGEDDQTWGAGFEQENGLCGIKGETWVWCGTLANLAGDSAGSTDDPSATELTGDEGDSTEPLGAGLPVPGPGRGLMPQSAPRPASGSQDAPARRPGVPLHQGCRARAVERRVQHRGQGVVSRVSTTSARATPRWRWHVLRTRWQPVCRVCRARSMSPPARGHPAGHHAAGRSTANCGRSLDRGSSSARATPGSSSDPDESAIYGTGPVIAHLGPTSMVTDELAQMANVAKNEFHLRAERLVAVTFDGCCHVGATVTLT